jgi:membrane protein required for colicin V production
MTVFDYIFLGLVILSAAVGTWRGVVSEVIGLLAWLVAFVASWLYASDVASLLSEVIAEPIWRLVSGFALIFVGVLLLAAVLRFLLRELLRATGLRPVDRALGTMFGLVRGLTIAALLVGVGGLLGAAKERWWADALFAPPLEAAVITAKPWLPDAVADRIRFR